jgi:hypothetical protein
MFKHLLQKVSEHFTGWLAGGLFIVATGFAPEEWVARLLQGLHLSDTVERMWPTGLDIRAAIVAVGVSIIVAEQVWKNRPRQRGAADASHMNGTRRAALTVGHDILIWLGAHVAGKSVSLRISESVIRGSLLTLEVTVTFPPNPIPAADALASSFLDYDGPIRVKLAKLDSGFTGYYEFGLAVATLSIQTVNWLVDKKPSSDALLNTMSSIIRDARKFGVVQSQISNLNRLQSAAKQSFSRDTALAMLNACEEMFSQLRANF